jgi:hypothetical protein
MSVKDRWIDHRKQVLNIPIAYQWYGPGKPSSLLSIEALLMPTTFLVESRRETGWGPVDRSASMSGMESGIPFSQELWDTSKFVGDSQKVAIHWPHEIRMVWDHTRTECGMRMTCWSSFPCRVYIDSNRRDSQIWVTACLWLSARR